MIQQCQGTQSYECRKGILINVLISIIFTLIFSTAAHSSQDQSNGFETDIYFLKLPDYMKQLNPPADVVGENSSRNFSFVYGDKSEKSKNLFLRILGEKSSSIKKADKSFALNTMTTALKSTVIYKECDPHVSEFVKARIDNSDAIHFEISYKTCQTRLQKIWCLIKGEYFISINLFDAGPAEERYWQEVEKYLSKIKFKIADRLSN
ncbi:MAG TPA: hypothetical protein VMB78_10465 [Dissulfurispiraceae bacterium]|nr:hypothetical protein [Dissulfurispiraceae bacterium]